MVISRFLANERMQFPNLEVDRNQLSNKRLSSGVDILDKSRSSSTIHVSNLCLSSTTETESHSQQR